jgi:hypothetical protein
MPSASIEIIHGACWGGADARDREVSMRTSEFLFRRNQMKYKLLQMLQNKPAKDRLKSKYIIGMVLIRLHF